MSSSRGVRFQWPPAPCVEEEPASLARELHGLSMLGEKPGVEGICRRGTVDQYPVILAPGSPLPTSPILPSASATPGLENISSDDNSTGLRTPSPRAPEPVVRNRAPLNEPLRPPPSSVSSRSQGRAPQTHQQPPASGQQPPRQPRPQSPPRDRDLDRGKVGYFPQNDIRGPRPEQGVQDRGYDLTNLFPPQESIRRSNSVRTGNSTGQMAPSRHYSEPNSGYQSDSSTTRGRLSSHVTSPVSTQSQVQVRRSPDAPTLSERIEEKLRLRHELRELGSDSDTEAPRRSRAKSISPKILPVAPAPKVQLVTREPSRAPSQRRQEPKELPPATRGRATSLIAPAPPALRSSSRAPSAMVSRSMSSDEAQASSSRPRRANSVRFQDDLPRHSAPPPAPAPELAPAPAPSQKASSPQRSTGVCVTPCPRSIPVAGLQDWYTLKGLTHLDICPACMNQIGHSRFRDYFIPSLPKPATQRIRCAFANAWTRLAWMQMIKKQHPSLEMLYLLTRPPPGISPCPGRTVVDQTWYRIVDPGTGMYVSGFHICSSCARNVRILMPSQRDTFEQSPEIQERMCDFVTTSPRFVHYIDFLDKAAAQTDPSHYPKNDDFLNYVRRKTVLRDCRRDRPTKGTWHYMPSLPELCVCEDCYDEVIWPLAKTNHPIAKSFLTTTRLLPGDTPNRCREASCQLYSVRMRIKFRDAVVNDDFAALKAVALRRFEAETRFTDRREELLEAEARGYDCSAELRKAIEEWRKWE
ncbi:hypothetical protein N7520_011328 [Penicillium odoratum]|uniref:uncharacterized protein n=1 Tax=Penicillium odoratum TaxID=1167516 RepID=UPI00254712BA|nr:uncharacterized protein N7520_011328 [Penicillium odoratum]KAJ5746146.1 hypothetical protein N7520_011328 [Penicillium odoratum]